MAEEREIKTQAIVIGNEDSGDADRIITLLTLDHGKIRAKIKGVKKNKAKLAFASFPFNFGEYILVKTGKNFTVTNCSYIDNFSSLVTDLNLYWAGAGILEIAKHLSREGENSYNLFILVLKTLKDLAYKQQNIFFVISKFLIEVLDLAGFKVSSKFKQQSTAYFDFTVGRLSDTSSEECVLLSNEDAVTLNSLISKENLHNNKTSKTILKLLILFYENKVDEEIKILKRFI